MGGQRFRAGGCYRIRIGKDTADAGCATLPAPELLQHLELDFAEADARGTRRNERKPQARGPIALRAGGRPGPATCKLRTGAGREVYGGRGPSLRRTV